jgi:uncharacterized protein (DUF488 family)
MPRIFTIGHSTRPFSELLAILRAHAIAELADVRTVPRSRHNPQYEGAALREALDAHGIVYRHWPALGGRRRPQPRSPNTGWRNASFRGYADHMQSGAFVEAIDALVANARARACVLMCAEAVPWRCHRSLIGDALLVRGFEVLDLLGVDDVRPHRLTAFARVAGTAITYPADDLLRDLA